MSGKEVLLNGRKASDTTAPVSKVSVICDAILKELLANYAMTHTQCILTAHLSKIPPDIISALRMIAKLKGIIRHIDILMSDENSYLMRSAIEHICFLADVNQLYEEALGLYRIDIALLVAQKSQKVSPPLEGFVYN